METPDPPHASSGLSRNVCAGAVTHVVNIALFMVMYPVYLHYLGYAQYGVWLALGTIVAFAQLGELGIGTAVAKLVAEAHGSPGDADAVPAYFFSAVMLMAVLGMASMVAVLILRGAILDLFALPAETLALARRFFPAIAVLSLMAIVVQPFPSLLEGLGRIDLAHYIRAAGRAAGFACTGSLLAAGYGLSSLVAGNALGFLVIGVASLACANRLTGYPLLGRPTWRRATVLRMLHFGTSLTAGRVVGMLIDPLNRVLLSRFAGVDALPVYDIAFRGCQTLRAGADVALRALVPEASRLHAQRAPADNNAIARLFRRTTGMLAVAGAGVGLPLAGAAGLLLALWLRADLHPAQTAVFRVMLAGTAISMISIPAYNIAMGMGHVRYAVISHVIQAGINVAGLSLCVFVWHTLTPGLVAWSLFSAWSAAACFMILSADRLTRSNVRPPLEAATTL
jgi:O-antigen/teichoic acid export membrane protein